MYALSSSQSGPFYAWDRRGVSFIGRHWRGGYSLAVAYWLFGLLVGLASGLVGAGMEWLANGIEYNPLHILLAAMLGWAVLILLSGWHLVGVWRSANRWRASGRAGFWGWAARLVTVAGFTQFAVVMGQVALPQFVALADIVVNGDSTIPDYTITVTDGGSDVEITGGFKYGLADALRRVLDAAPGVRVLALQSPGGRIGEARAVYRLIVDRRLNTVTNTYCMSACTYAFLGGSRRWLGVGARLGFHAGHFVGMSQAVVARQQRGFFAEVTARDGVPPAFFAHANSIAPTEMWYPTRSELLANHVLTDQVSGAASSLRLFSASLRAATQQINKGLPKQIDWQTTLVRATTSGFTLTYVYRIASLKHSTLPRDGMDYGFSHKIISTVCGHKKMRRDVEAGVVYRFEYHLRDDPAVLYAQEVQSCP
jgi:hypothetical protein